MPGSGTDRTRPAVQAVAPVIILVEPQMAENISLYARALATFVPSFISWASRG